MRKPYFLEQEEGRLEVKSRVALFGIPRDHYSSLMNLLRRPRRPCLPHQQKSRIFIRKEGTVFEDSSRYDIRNQMRRGWPLKRTNLEQRSGKTKEVNNSVKLL